MATAMPYHGDRPSHGGPTRKLNIWDPHPLCLCQGRQLMMSRNKRMRDDRDQVDEQLPTHQTKCPRRNDEFPASVQTVPEQGSVGNLVDPTSDSCRTSLVQGNDSKHTEDHISALLDFTPSFSQDEILSRFDSISSVLLSEYYLSVVHGGSESNYEIIELEFYLQKPGYHDDPFTHGSVEQEQSGQWYFHRAPTRANGMQKDLTATGTAAGGYRGGTRKGLDLTFGGPVYAKASSSCLKCSVLRGGALLRTIRRCHDKKVISGPSLLVDEILRLCSASNINELVSTRWQGDISALSPPSQPRSTYMYLRKRSASTHVTSRMFRSPRIGLDLSNQETTASVSHPRVIFVGKLYRYFTHPELLIANGRTQTFVGLYLALAHEKKYEVDSLMFRSELNKLTGIKDSTLVKYLSDYRWGFENGKLEGFIGAPGKGVASSASSYLKMMGMLARILPGNL